MKLMNSDFVPFYRHIIMAYTCMHYFLKNESHEEYVDIEGYEDDESSQATKAVLDTSLAHDLQLSPENSDDEDHRPSKY